MILIKVLLLFFIAFDPQVPFLPNGVGFCFLSMLILLPKALLKLKNHESTQLILWGKPYFWLFFICAIYITLRLLFNGGINFEFYLSFFRGVVVFLSIILWLIVFNNDFKQKNNFIYFILFIYTVNAVINLLAGTFPDAFSFLESLRGATISEELGKNPYRNSFISGSGYYSIGTAYGLIALLISFFIVKTNVKVYIAPIILGIISLTGFVAARTSFFGVAAALLYLIQARPVYFVYFVGVGVVLINLMVALPLLSPYLNWMGSFFELQNSSSANYLIEHMYFWPETDVLFYGQGIVNDGSHVYTDGGYMNDVLFGGVLFLLLKLSFLGIFIISNFRFYPLFTFLVSFSVLAFHFKGVFLYNNAQGMAVFYFIYFYLANLKSNEIKKNYNKVKC